MFLHELSRKLIQQWPIRVDGEEYEGLVRQTFNNKCPYCFRDLADTVGVIEHLDGMNRYRAGLHVPGNVLVACRRCNSEKRRDDSVPLLSLASSGWESFMSHEGSRCAPTCLTCLYWKSVWMDETERRLRMSENVQRIRAFRGSFAEVERKFPYLAETLPTLLTKLYADCQVFAETEIKSLLNTVERLPDVQI